MMKKIVKLALAMLAMSATHSAFAAPDATLYFNGNILAASCTVDPDSVTRTITLDPAVVTSFPSVGTTQNPKAFDLHLTNCTNGVHVTMAVSGTSDTVASVLKNTTGSATQVGIQLLLASASGGTTGNAITLNSGSIDMGTVGATNALTIPMVAQYYRLGTMTAGTVGSTATVNFTYN
ncbi:fimbrial protein [Caballeronia sp. BR00000012568055]|uniref:fimbrial protein n=1 Tax=Caballeronia sp. BR00000012568055 TaxID=2918761 RepID=UPI0023F62F17|nr:fimbrial protein [Caballeronia sp. BR00000012568055]